MNILQKLTPIAATVLLSLGSVSAAQADDSKYTSIMDNLSISGFIDMSYVYADPDGGDSVSVSGIDQAEIDISYDFGNKLTATVDIEYQNSAEGVDLEQAFITYAVSDSFTVKAGRFLSYTGWETEEPTGLFQYSGAGYAPYFYGYYQQGISGLYTGDGFSAAVSLVNDLAGPQSVDSEEVGVETMLAIMPSDSVTVKGFYSFEKLAGTDEDTTLVNLWASYAKDALTLAVEYNMSENAPAYVWAGAGVDADATGFLLMANYGFESFALTVRYHDWEIEDASGATFEDASGFTISPSFSVNENLLMVFEYRMDEINDVDINTFAVEALITF